MTNIFAPEVKSLSFPIDFDTIEPTFMAFVPFDAPTFNISGHVTVGGAGTTVEISYLPIGNVEQISVRTSTDASGYYEFRNLAPNTYRIRATRAGFVFSQPPDVDLQADEALDIYPSFCYYTAGSLSAVSAGGGVRSFSITTNHPSCQWFAVSQVPWIEINLGSGIGNGEVYFTAQANEGTARISGIIRVAGTTDILIRQAPRPVPFDYDGDTKTDISIFRSTSGAWNLLLSEAGL